MLEFLVGASILVVNATEGFMSTKGFFFCAYHQKWKNTLDVSCFFVGNCSACQCHISMTNQNQEGLGPLIAS